MTRLFTEGFEMGDLLGVDSSYLWTITTASKRSGLYAAYCSNTNAANEISITVDSKTELYSRVAYRFSSRNENYKPILTGFYNSGNLLVGISPMVNLNDLAVVIGSTYTNIGVNIGEDWMLLEVYVKIDDTIGEIIVKLNGSEVYSFIGDTKPTAATTIDSVKFRTAPFNNMYVDDIAINDTAGAANNSWCGNGHVIAVKPNGEGDNIDLDGSDGNQVDNHLLVDEVPPDGDDTYVSGTTAEDYDLYELESPGLPDGAEIKRVWPEARAKDDALGDLALMLKAGTTEDEDTAVGLSSEYGVVKGADRLLNPDDSAAWEEADLDALQVGVKIK